MTTTKLSSKGQVIIPKAIRSNHQWKSGQELVVIETDDGILLKPVTKFSETSLDDVAGCLPHHGPPLSIQDMDQAIGTAVMEQAKQRKER